MADVWEAMVRDRGGGGGGAEPPGTTSFVTNPVGQRTQSWDRGRAGRQRYPEVVFYQQESRTSCEHQDASRIITVPLTFAAVDLVAD